VLSLPGGVWVAGTDAIEIKATIPDHQVEAALPATS